MSPDSQVGSPFHYICLTSFKIKEEGRPSQGHPFRGAGVGAEPGTGGRKPGEVKQRPLSSPRIELSEVWAVLGERMETAALELIFKRR